MKPSIISIPIVALAILPASAATTSFNFNTVGDTEGFTASTTPTGAVVTGFTAALGIDNTTGVLTSSDIEGDPQIGFGSNTATLPSGDVWSTFSVRFRQLADNPGTVGVASATFSNAGLILFFNGTLQNRTPAAGGISTQSYTGTGGIYASDTYGMTLTAQADNWQLMTLDLSSAPGLGGTNINNFRFVPIGNTPAGNFEIDFVEFVSVPEPSSALLTALASSSLLLRRRK
ncbi:PEP-CTERM sorting domain-containing protein [Akkermansiaceae bacterium]|nr:PEP-CTERM sorting domain-containing protein [Akkermansiaceae bacterium]